MHFHFNFHVHVHVHFPFPFHLQPPQGSSTASTSHGTPSPGPGLPQARAIVLVPTTDRFGNVVFEDRLVSVHGYGAVPPGMGAGAGSPYSSIDDDDEVRCGFFEKCTPSTV